MQYPHARILVFCKAPQIGKVKTRLAENIGKAAATAVHEQLARHCLQQVVSYALAPVELWCAPDVTHEFFQQCHKDLGVTLKQQLGEDLGQRMQHALRETLRNDSPVILIGTDCPGLSAEYISTALLATSLGSTVIGPAEDGGYVLLGVSELEDDIFVDMPWGTEEVYAKTMARLSGKIESLSPLWDVDRIEDLRRLRDSANELPLDINFVSELNGLELS